MRTLVRSTLSSGEGTSSDCGRRMGSGVFRLSPFVQRRWCAQDGCVSSSAGGDALNSLEGLPWDRRGGERFQDCGHVTEGATTTDVGVAGQPT